MKRIPTDLAVFLLVIGVIAGVTYTVYHASTRPVITEAHTVSEVRYLTNACTGDVSIETVYDNYIPVLWRVRCATRSE